MGMLGTVGIEQPQVGERRIAGTVDLSEMSIATSGNYRQRLHLIDPTSGKPVERMPMAVCVLHESAMVADAWATALFVAGMKEGIRLADERELAVAYLSDKGDPEDPEILLSKVFRRTTEAARSSLLSEIQKRVENSRSGCREHLGLIDRARCSIWWDYHEDHSRSHAQGADHSAA